MHLPFVMFALWLGAGLWWVCRRMFGNEGAFFALGLYCFCPAVVRSAVTPNNDVLAMWGLYGLVYTAIGVAHAMQGPRRKWRPRIVLLTLALGLTAAAIFLYRNITVENAMKKRWVRGVIRGSGAGTVARAMDLMQEIADFKADR